MIHRYKLNGLNIVVDVNSGAIHVVDDLTYDILENYPDISGFDNCDSEQVSQVLTEIELIKEQGRLFSQEIEMGDYDENRQPVIKALCLNVAHDCNLMCGYCFAGRGLYNGESSLMSLDIGKAAIDFIVKNSGNRRNLEIDFFGGEPLMNFDVVKGIVHYARGLEKIYNKVFRFTLTTNGLLLDDEKLEFINANMKNLVLSLDGRKEVNDGMRRLKSGFGSYRVIVPKLVKAADSRNQDNYYLRGTFTRFNLDFSEDVKHIASLGFKQISVEPVVGEGGYAITHDDVPEICRQYELLAKNILQDRKNGNYYNFFHFMIDFEGGPCIYKRLAGCGAATEYMAVAPDGKLYPCHQFVGKDNFVLGDVFDGVKVKEIGEAFDKCNVLTKEECRNCWAKFYCSGGCAANAYNINGDIMKPWEIGCILQRKRVECAIMIKAMESES